MRFTLFRIIFYTIIITLVAILYVNQQALIYQMGLRVKENYQLYSRLVDRNKILMYNVLNLKSPIHLETRLSSQNVKMDVPRSWQVVSVRSLPTEFKNIKETKKRGLFANLFNIGREAEASPNNKVRFGFSNTVR